MVASWPTAFSLGVCWRRGSVAGLAQALLIVVVVGCGAGLLVGLGT